MIIKIILIIFAYLLIGIAVLEGVLWRDRRKSYIDRWVDDDEDAEMCIVVIFWPIAIPLLLAYILYILLKHLIKCVRIFFTTIVYLIVAIIDKERGDKE